MTTLRTCEVRGCESGLRRSAGHPATRVANQVLSVCWVPSRRKTAGEFTGTHPRPKRRYAPVMRPDVDLNARKLRLGVWPRFR